MQHKWVTPLRNVEINIRQYGREECEPCHFFGPCVRDHFLLHFVANGKGKFASNGQEYALSGGDGFVIFPDEITFYEADGKEPWQYFWVGFSGENAGNLLEELGFSPAFPVFRFRDPRAVEELFDDMNRIDESTQEGQLCLTGNLYMLLSRIHPVSGAPAIRKNFGGKKEYVEQAIRYIQENYPTEVSVEDIARRLGINRSYFYTLFKEHTHTSPREFLITARITKAEELLKSGKLNVTGVARSVGYEDVLQFSKLFKKHIGCSPTDYRKKHRG